MEYYVVLGLSTVAIAALAAALYRKRGEAGLVVGIAALYYWSLYGAWFVVTDKIGGFSGKSYHYLEHKMFPVSLDASYMTALGLYAGFIVMVELTMLAALARRNTRTIPKLVLRHEPILILGVAAGIGSFLLIRGKLDAAWAMNTSAYWYTRSETDQWFTLHQVLNRVALIPASIGVATLAAGRRSRFFVNAVRRYTWPGYVVLLGGMAAFTFVLGNKNEVFTAMLTGLLAYVASVERPPWLRIACAAVLGLWFLYAIDYFRATPITSMSAVAGRVDEATGMGRFVTSSNEAFAAHFSLYGVLASRTEPQFGYSLYSLACSVIPRVIWRDRPRDIYLYYSQSVGAIQNQGYSLHHATGWYLNFGYAGVALGALVMGLAWAGCLNARQRTSAKAGLVYRLFSTIAPWVFAAGLPPLIRAGPEGYKGLFIESFLIPVAVLACACRTRQPAQARLAWDPAQGWVLRGSPGTARSSEHFPVPGSAGVNLDGGRRGTHRRPG